MIRQHPLAVPLLALAAGLSLAAAPPLPRTDLHGDPLPSGARARLGTTRLRHGHTISAIAFSKDGRFIASSASDHTVRLWDAKTFRLVRCIGLKESLGNVYHGSRWVTAVALSADGKLIASSSNAGVVLIHDADTGKELRRLGVGFAVHQLAFSGDAKVVAMSGPGVGLWEHPAAGKITWLKAGAWEGRLAFARDGKTLASGSTNGSLRLWDVGKAKVLHQLSRHLHAVNAVDFSPNGNILLSVDAAGVLAFHDTPTGAWSPGGRIGVAWAAFLDDKKIVVAERAKGSIQILEVRRETPPRIIARYSAPPAVLAVSPDGKRLAAGDGGAIRLWDLGAGRRIPLPAGHEAGIQFLAFAPGSKEVISSAGDGTFRTWESNTGRPLRSSAPEVPKASALPVNATGAVGAAATADGMIIIQDLHTGKALRRFKTSLPNLSCHALSADGRTLATSLPSGEIISWQCDTGKELHRFKGHAGGVLAVRFSPTGDLLASSGPEGTVRLWNVRTGRELRRLETGYTRSALAFSPDGRCLAGGGTDGAVRVWETASGQLICSFTGLRGYVQSVAFSRDGRFLAAGHWMGVRLFDLATRTSRGDALGYQGDGTALAFSEDGKVLASGGADTTVLLWNVASAWPSAPVKPNVLQARDLEAAWTDLAGTDAGKANAAVWSLAGAPEQSVPFLTGRLQPVKPPTEKKLAELLAALGDEDAQTSRAAMKELEALGDPAGPALRKALPKAKDADVQLRLRVLLRRLDAEEWDSRRLREWRAVQALELAATPAARKLLARLAAGAPAARLTREAAVSSARLARRAGE
jgi:WD40 repeat protein